MSLPLLERRLLCPYQERRQGNQALSSDDGSPDCEPRARFKQEQREIDRSQGKLTLAELCDRYIKTVQHQTPKTVTRKPASLRTSKSTGRSEALSKWRKSNRVKSTCG